MNLFLLPAPPSAESALSPLYLDTRSVKEGGPFLIRWTCASSEVSLPSVGVPDRREGNSGTRNKCKARGPALGLGPGPGYEDEPDGANTSISLPSRLASPRRRVLVLLAARENLSAFFYYLHIRSPLVQHPFVASSVIILPLSPADDV